MTRGIGRLWAPYFNAHGAKAHHPRLWLEPRRAWMPISTRARAWPGYRHDGGSLPKSRYQRRLVSNRRIPCPARPARLIQAQQQDEQRRAQARGAEREVDGVDAPVLADQHGHHQWTGEGPEAA